MANAKLKQASSSTEREGGTAVTILHLSDLQFGRNHRFGRLGLPPPDDTFDSLIARLAGDLRLLKEQEGLAPHLVVVSGDLGACAVERSRRHF